MRIKIHDIITLNPQSNRITDLLDTQARFWAL